MGLRSRKIHALSLVLLFLAVFGLAESAIRAQELTSGSYTVLKRYIFPRYGGKSEIQYLVYGDTAVNKGSLIYLTMPMIDIVDGSYTSLRQLDIVDAKDVYPKPYELGSELSTLRSFWTHSHHRHSQAWIFADKATFDKSTNILTSDEIAHFRSSELDADGVGFDAFNDRKFIHIRSNVRVVLRLRENSLNVQDPDASTSNKTAEQK